MELLEKLFSRIPPSTASVDFKSVCTLLHPLEGIPQFLKHFTWPKMDRTLNLCILPISLGRHGFFNWTFCHTLARGKGGYNSPLPDGLFLDDKVTLPHIILSHQLHGFMRQGGEARLPLMYVERIPRMLVLFSRQIITSCLPNTPALSQGSFYYPRTFLCCGASGLSDSNAFPLPVGTWNIMLAGLL